MLFISNVKLKLVPAVFTALSFTVLFGQDSLASSGPACLGFYKPSTHSSSSVHFWPPRENAVMATDPTKIAHLLATDSARAKQSGRRKVFAADVVGRELYTPENAPDQRSLYNAHKIMLGDLIKSDLYADALIDVLIEDKVNTPEEIRKFVSSYYGWARFNPSASDKFLGRAASEFALRLNAYIGENVNYAKFDEAMTKYGLSVEDLIELKNNLALLRQNNDGNLKLSMMLPMLADGPLITKLLEEALSRKAVSTNLTVVPPQSTAIELAKTSKPSIWNMQAVKNIGKKIFNSNQGRFNKLSQAKSEALVARAAELFNLPRTKLSEDRNVLRDMNLGISKQKEFSLIEIITFIKKAPGYFLVSRDEKNRGHSAVDTHLRIQNFIETLSRIKLEKTGLNREHFIELQLTLDTLGDLIYQIERTFTREVIQLDGNLAENIFVADVPTQNKMWEAKTTGKIILAQKQLTEFYLEVKERDGITQQTPYEAEIINRTKINPVITAIFLNAQRIKSDVQPTVLIKALAENQLSADDVVYVLGNYKTHPQNSTWQQKDLYSAARLPILNSTDVNNNLTHDFEVLATRLAMSFDTKSQRLSLNQFNAIFEILHRFGTTESILGKAALAKFYKSVIGPSPKDHDQYILNVNASEAYLGLLKTLPSDPLQFLDQNFDLQVDPKIAAQPGSEINSAQGRGTVLILNWIKSEYYASARNQK